jgi:endonuclease YncB( thermonuclease family)
MFKLLRKVVMVALLAIVGGVAFYFLSQPSYRREIAQTAEEFKEAVKDEKMRPIWKGTAVVVEVLAGDTVRVDTEGSRNVIVHLAGIDAPEMPEKAKRNGQPLAEESRNFLSENLNGKAVSMAILKMDAAKRPLVLLTLDGALVNAKVVGAGFAESGADGIECIPAKLRHAIENAELSAKEHRFNIWGLTNYVRPAEFRIRQQRGAGLVKGP